MFFSRQLTTTSLWHRVTKLSKAICSRSEVSTRSRIPSVETRIKILQGKFRQRIGNSLPAGFRSSLGEMSGSTSHAETTTAKRQWSEDEMLAAQGLVELVMGPAVQPPDNRTKPSLESPVEDEASVALAAYKASEEECEKLQAADILMEIHQGARLSPASSTPTLANESPDPAKLVDPDETEDEADQVSRRTNVPASTTPAMMTRGRSQNKRSK